MVTPPPDFEPPRDLYRGRPWTLLSVVTDAMLLWVAVALAVAIAPRGQVPAGGVALGALFALITVTQLGVRGMYDARSARSSMLDGIREVLSAHASGAVGALALAALFEPRRASTSMLVLAAGLSAVLILTFRWCLSTARRRARRAGRSGRRVLIVGAGTTAAQLERRLLERPGLGLHPVGFLDAAPSPGFRDHAPKTPVLGAPEDLPRIAASTGAEHVIFAYGSSYDRDLLATVREAQRLGLRVSIVPRLFEAIGARTHVDHVGGIPLVITRQTLPNEWPFLVKHVVGRAIALGVALAALPLLAILALAVRLSSPGPVLFRQRRVGRDGRVFDLFKFRTMKLPDPGECATVAAGNGPGGVEGVDRRTRVGTFLRRTSLDELPQLLNVIQGHMSLVGPRPERPEWVARLGDEVRHYDQRHRVKSGMTGWAQVHGLRGQTSITERIELDNWYVQNYSLWLDVKILLLTPVEVIRSRAEASTGTATSAEDDATEARALAEADVVVAPPAETPADPLEDHVLPRR